MDASYSVCLQVLVFVATFFIALSYWISNHYKYWEKLGVPSANSIPFLGNLSFIMRISVTEFFHNLGKKYKYDYYGIYLGWKPAMVVQTPELVKKVLVKDADQFPDRYLYTSTKKDPLGSLNLFTVKDPIWLNMRHELSPMFTTLRLKTITELMNKNATELVQKVQRDHIDNKKPVDLKELFSMYTSDTVAYSVFGQRMSVLSDQPSPLWLITNHMVKWTFWRGLEFTLIFFLPYIAQLLRLKFFSTQATEYIKKLFWNVVQERNAKNDISSYDKDLVNHLLKLKENAKLPANADPELADNLMLAQAAVFILGSIETSSATLACCIHELAHHPEKQEKLYNEINDAVRQKEKDILEYHDLLELKYLSACVYETLRKYPTLPYLDRVSKTNYKLTDDLTIEKGTPVFVNVLAIHYNEKVYPQPEEWRPERTLPTSDNDNLQYNYLPFGEGPRFCIGKRYGLMQVRAALAQLLHKFEVRPVSNKTKITFDPYSVIISPQCDVAFFPRRP